MGDPGVARLRPQEAAPKRRSPLERGVIARGLRREMAATYVGVSPSKFDQWVLNGTMPEPRRKDGCVIWDRYELDEAFDALPIEGENEWDSVLKS